MNKINSPEFGIKIAAATVIAAVGAYFINKLDDTPIGDLLQRDEYITKLQTQQEDESDLPGTEEFDEDNPVSEYGSAVDRDDLDIQDEPLDPELDRDALDRQEPLDPTVDRQDEPLDPAVDRQDDTLDPVVDRQDDRVDPAEVRNEPTESSRISLQNEPPRANPGMVGGRRSMVCKHCYKKLRTRRKYR